MINIQQLLTQMDEISIYAVYKTHLRMSQYLVLQFGTSAKQMTK